MVVPSWIVYGRSEKLFLAASRRFRYQLSRLLQAGMPSTFLPESGRRMRQRISTSHSAAGSGGCGPFSSLPVSKYWHRLAVTPVLQGAFRAPCRDIFCLSPPVSDFSATGSRAHRTGRLRIGVVRVWAGGGAAGFCRWTAVTRRIQEFDCEYNSYIVWMSVSSVNVFLPLLGFFSSIVKFIVCVVLSVH